MAKKGIILQHTGGEIGSQLWNFVSVYAYCLERGISCENHSFYEFYEFFPQFKPKNILVYILFFIPFIRYRGRKDEPFVKFFRFIFRVYVRIIKTIFKSGIIVSDETNKDQMFYLPPSGELREINVMEKRDTFYFDKRIFRNPIGIEKHREKIISAFTPQKDIRDEVANKLKRIRSEFDFVVGVHIRQGEYMTFKRGKFFVDQGHMRTFIDEFISKFKIDKKKICFYITSDSPIEERFFYGLSYKIGGDNLAIEMFTLAGTDVIIGSDSHFGSFASYYGNIPHIVCHRTDIDWDYYKDKDTFFQNKYWKVSKA